MTEEGQAAGPQLIQLSTINGSTQLAHAEELFNQCFFRSCSTSVACRSHSYRWAHPHYATMCHVDPSTSIEYNTIRPWLSLVFSMSNRILLRRLPSRSGGYGSWNTCRLLLSSG